jgi:hypothetical protein
MKQQKTSEAATDMLESLSDDHMLWVGIIKELVVGIPFMLVSRFVFSTSSWCMVVVIWNTYLEYWGVVGGVLRVLRTVALTDLVDRATKNKKLARVTFT